MDKKTIPSSNVTVDIGATGKTISTVVCYMHGSTAVVELNYSTGPTGFVKFKGGQMEVGGTNEWGTGTISR